MTAASEYLIASEYATYGLPTSTTPAQIIQASSLINGYLMRPEGLLWLPDAAGTPALMGAQTPAMTLRSVSGVAPGANVAVATTGGLLDQNQVGEPMVLDAADNTKCEVCVIATIVGATITLTSVTYNHSANVTMDLGCLIREEKEMPKDRSVTRLTRTPIVRVVSGAGRYGYGRRSQQQAGDFQDFNVLASVAQFGGPPIWMPWSVTNTSYSPVTGELWVPSGIMLAYYTEVRVWYVAGWQQTSLPYPVKQAVASLVKTMSEGGLGANIQRRSSSLGTGVSKFENTMIDPDMRRTLAPFMAKIYG